MAHSYPLPTRVHRLGLRLRPMPTLGSPLVQYRLTTASAAEILGTGHPHEDPRVAQLRALASHPLGRAALWPPYGTTLCRCPACQLEH